jgi:predicted nucleotidyltransferase
MTDRNTVLSLLSEHRGELRNLGVRRIGLFGSVAAGTARADSDLDILVDLESVSFDRYMDLKLYLEDLFKNRVDLVPEGDLKPALRGRILSEAEQHGWNSF